MKGIEMNTLTQLIRRHTTITSAAIVAVAFASAIMAANFTGTVSAAGEPAQGLVPASALTTGQLEDAYRAFADGEVAFQEAMNAIAALKANKVAGVDLTADQKDALRNQGLYGLGRAKQRYGEGMQILGVTQGQLDAYMSTRPVPDVCYRSVEVCE